MRGEPRARKGVFRSKDDFFDAFSRCCVLNRNYSVSPRKLPAVSLAKASRHGRLKTFERASIGGAGFFLFL
jgi:hypothetical protein